MALTLGVSVVCAVVLGDVFAGDIWDAGRALTGMSSLEGTSLQLFWVMYLGNVILGRGLTEMPFWDVGMSLRLSWVVCLMFRERCLEGVFKRCSWVLWDFAAPLSLLLVTVSLEAALALT